MPTDDKLMEKFDNQKRVLQRYVLKQLEDGVANGLSGAAVATLRDGLLALGWLPPDVNPQRSPNGHPRPTRKDEAP